MADSLITISTPAATIVDAVARIYVSTWDGIATFRTTASQASRDADDHIRQQMYWDSRQIWQRLGLVGDPMPWPPVGAPPVLPPGK